MNNYLVFQNLLNDYMKETRNHRPEIRFLAEGADHVIFSFCEGKRAKIAKLPKYLSFLPQIKKEIKFLEFLHSYCPNH